MNTKTSKNTIFFHGSFPQKNFVLNDEHPVHKYSNKPVLTVTLVHQHNTYLWFRFGKILQCPLIGRIKNLFGLDLVRLLAVPSI